MFVHEIRRIGNSVLNNFLKIVHIAQKLLEPSILFSVIKSFLYEFGEFI